MSDLTVKGSTRRALKAQQDQYKAMLKMFMEAREMTKILKSKEGGDGGNVGAIRLHWDLLHVHTWLDSLI